MNEYVINNLNYKLEENNRDGFDLEEVKSKLTDYFYPFDYIVGDWAYGKLRLKGFYSELNANSKDLNNIKYVKKYITENCAYNCKYFILKKCVQK